MTAGKRKGWTLAGVALVLAAICAGIGVAVATGGDDDQSIAGDALEKATKAALGHTGGGTVVETEIGDDGAAYGVEIRLADGRQVEVNLDQSFNVIGQEADDADDNEDGADDD